MGFRRKTDDINNKPFDPNASPETKAKEFDQQYGQNRKPTTSPNLDAQRKQSGSKDETKPKGRHRK